MGDRLAIGGRNPTLERGELCAQCGIVDQPNAAGQQHRQGVQIVLAGRSLARHEADAVALPLVGVEAAGESVALNLADLVAFSSRAYSATTSRGTKRGRRSRSASMTTVRCLIVQAMGDGERECIAAGAAGRSQNAM